MRVFSVVVALGLSFIASAAQAQAPLKAAAAGRTGGAVAMAGVALQGRGHVIAAARGASAVAIAQAPNKPGAGAVSGVLNIRGQRIPIAVAWDYSKK